MAGDRGWPEMSVERRPGAAGDLVVVTFERPRALNAITLEQFRALQRGLDAWRDDAELAVAVVQGAGGKAFSAGGDVRALWDARRRGDRAFMDHVYREEYVVDYCIHKFPKPWVALMDGIVMGGGAGVAQHGSHRIATERTLFAMPETGIGFFPDVGASYFLNRAPGQVGVYLALTGARLGPADALYAGAADAFVPHAALGDLLADLAVTGDVDRAVAAHLGDPGPPSLTRHRAAIDRCFAGESVSAILEALAAEPGEWARETLETLRAKPPFSLAVTLRQMREGRGRPLAECLVTEFRLSQRFMDGHDFFEGVRALIVDKDGRPEWRPARIDDVDPADVEAVFAPMKDDLRLPCA